VLRHTVVDSSGGAGCLGLAPLLVSLAVLARDGPSTDEIVGVGGKVDVIVLNLVPLSIVELLSSPASGLGGLQ